MNLIRKAAILASGVVLVRNLVHPTITEEAATEKVPAGLNQLKARNFKDAKVHIKNLDVKAMDPAQADVEDLRSVELLNEAFRYLEYEIMESVQTGRDVKVHVQVKNLDMDRVTVEWTEASKPEILARLVVGSYEIDDEMMGSLKEAMRIAAENGNYVRNDIVVHVKENGFALTPEHMNKLLGGMTA